MTDRALAELRTHETDEHLADMEWEAWLESLDTDTIAEDLELLLQNPAQMPRLAGEIKRSDEQGIGALIMQWLRRE